MNKHIKHDISVITDIDWNKVISTIKESSPQKSNNSSGFWDRRASSFADHAGRTFYPDSIIKIIDPEPSWTVLDMGCGGGTLAIPLADRVKHITAVDFSVKMIEILGTEAHRRGLSNIKTIQASWADNWPESGIDTYDVAIASRSLAVDDISSAIIKLNNASRKRVVISTVTGDGPFDRKMLNALGRDHNAGVDYIYYYNLLYQMGINANISFITENTNRTFQNQDDAFESHEWMIQDMTPDEEILLKKYLDDHLVKINDRFELDYRKTTKWAVIWWDK